MCLFHFITISCVCSLPRIAIHKTSRITLSKPNQLPPSNFCFLFSHVIPSLFYSEYILISFQTSPFTFIILSIVIPGTPTLVSTGNFSYHSKGHFHYPCSIISATTAELLILASYRFLYETKLHNCPISDHWSCQIRVFIPFPILWIIWGLTLSLNSNEDLQVQLSNHSSWTSHLLSFFVATFHICFINNTSFHRPIGFKPSAPSLLGEHTIFHATLDLF